MTRLVFAAWGSGLRAERLLRLHQYSSCLPVNSVLASRAVPREIESCIAYAKLIPKQVDLWLDSGAFSAWTLGHVYHASEYLNFVHKLIPSLRVFRRVFVMSLDKIPGRCGEPVMPQDIQDAVNQTLENTQFLLSNGLNVVPIHHQGEPLWVMKEYLAMSEYVGISPANDRAQASRLKYITSLWPLFKEQRNQPAHNFGNTSPAQLKAFPFYSADSTNWKVPMFYGRELNVGICRNNLHPQTQQISIRAKREPVQLLLENVKKLLTLEQDLKKLWAYRGISWKEPQGINL